MSLPTPEQIAPLSGSATIVSTYANKYTQTATAISDAAKEIRRLVSNTTAGQSEAVDALIKNSTDVADRLDRLHYRYSTAGSSLTTYSSALSSAKTLANSAVSIRDTAEGDIATGNYWVSYYEDERDAATDETEKLRAQAHIRQWEEAVSDAASSLYYARQVYQQAVTDRDTAANVASTSIGQAIDTDGLKDSPWDDFSGWVQENAEWIKILKNVLSIISTILGVLSLFFPVLAPFALIFAGAAALLSLILALTGAGSWIEFGLDLLAFATLGVGAIVGGALKGTMAALKVTRIVNVTSQAGSKNPLRVINGSFAGVLPSRTTMLGKLDWGLEILLQGGKENAIALRILNNAKAGSGGLLDGALVSLGQLQVGALQVMNIAGGLQDAAGYGLEYNQQLTDAFNGTGIDAIGDGIDGIGDWWEGVNDSATWRVGSNW